MLYRYQPPGSTPCAQSDSERALVPPLLHHVFLTDGTSSASLDKYTEEIQSCIDLHANWTSYIWNDTSADDFIQTHYPHLYPHYTGYPQRIQRANILRYAVLDHFGGVYLDLDITCRQPLDDLRSLPWLTPAAHPAGVNNAFILTRPHHPLLRTILAAAPSRNMNWGLPYVANMLSTGCMFFSNRWMEHARAMTRREQHHQSVADDDRLYVLADESGNVEPHMLRGVVTTPLFTHGGVSSWHGWDAAAIVLIGAHYGYILLFICAMTVGVVALFGSRYWRRQLRRRQRGCSPGRASLKLNCKIDDEERCVGAGKLSMESRSSFIAPRRSGSLPSSPRS